MGFSELKASPEAVFDLLSRGVPFVLATVVETASPALLGLRLLVGENGELAGSTGVPSWDAQLAKAGVGVLSSGPQLLTTAEGSVFLDPMLPVADLLICGAGHIALPLARFGLELGYRVTVVDDREDFASEERFPGCRVIAEDFGVALASFPFSRTTYAVVITRGHVHDIECLHMILPRVSAYVGLIGSRRRVGFVKKELAASGVSQEVVEGLHTPIGLAIGAESPAEIALSIMAEITAVRRLGPQAGRELSARGGGR